MMTTKVPPQSRQSETRPEFRSSRRKMLKVGALSSALSLAGLCDVAGAKNGPGEPAIKRGWTIANGKSLRFELSGTGDTTLVLIHELGMCLETWDEVLPLLKPGQQVLRYDLHGFGLSEKITGTVGFDDALADLRGLLDGLGITQPVVLVGSALGGAIGLQFAAKYPNRVKSVVALSPAIGVSEKGRPAMLALADRLEKMNMHDWVVDAVDGAFPGGISTPERRLRFGAMQAANQSSNCAAMVRMIALADFSSSVFSRIKAPTLIVAAALDKGRSIESMRDVASLIGGARFTTLSSGHFMPVQIPAELAGLLNEFLSKS